MLDQLYQLKLNQTVTEAHDCGRIEISVHWITEDYIDLGFKCL